MGSILYEWYCTAHPQGSDGIQRLFDLLRNRYGQTLEGRRQIAILFSFLEKDQPVERIAQLLSDTDNASIVAFRLITGCVVACPCGEMGIGPFLFIPFLGGPPAHPPIHSIPTPTAATATPRPPRPA